MSKLTQASKVNVARHEDLLRHAPRTIFAVAVGMTVVYAAFFASYPFGKNPEAWGAMGDFFGGLLNPLIGIWTLTVAVSLLRTQKAELEATTAALAAQAQNAQDALVEQRFYSLLTMYQRVLDSVEAKQFEIRDGARVEKGELQGRLALLFLIQSQHLYKQFQTFGVGSIRDANAPWIPTEDELRRDWPNVVEYSAAAAVLRTLTALLLEVELLCRMTDSVRFVSLIRAQLTDAELTLLGLDAWLGSGASQSRRLVEQYGLLTHLASGKLRDCLEGLLSVSAFTHPTPRFAAPATQ
jgi:hypothetical protein